MEIWIATHNTGKLTEFKQLLEPQGFVVHSARELEFFTAPAETGKTFEENARIKARALKAVKPGVWVLADDSGLEVKGLGGLPGIHSARYAGDKASDNENVAKLLKMLQIRSPMERSATFRATFVLFSPQGQEHVVHGELNGQISQKVAGQHGFGYDPVFVPESQTKTMAELGAAYKNQHSHRAKAIKAALALIKAGSPTAEPSTV
jgi:XTP/dITP diphosphohydrolase